MEEITFTTEPAADHKWGSRGYAEPYDKTGALLAILKINILGSKRILYSDENGVAFEFQVEFYYEPKDDSKPRWVKTLINSCGPDTETAIQWVIYRVQEYRKLADMYYQNREKADLEKWY